MKAIITVLILVPLIAWSGAPNDQDTTPDDPIKIQSLRKRFYEYGTPVEGKEPFKVLFIGNSYTASAGGQYYIVPEMLAESGRFGVAASYIRAGETLEGFVKKNAGGDEDKFKGELDTMIGLEKWNAVVIQSWHGARTLDNPAFFDNLEIIVHKIRENHPGTFIVLYMTWSGQNAPEGQEVITANCVKAAKRFDLLLAPAGEAAWAAKQLTDSLRIHRTEKDSHPGLDGGYLIACTIFSALTGRSAEGLSHRYTIPISYDFPVVVRTPNRNEILKEQYGDAKEADYVIDPKKAAVMQKIAWQECNKFNR